MKKIVVNMLSKADSVKGQGVGSAYLEQVNLVKQSKKLEILINSSTKADILHVHTIEPENYLKMKRNKKGVNVCYVHFLPTTLDGSIKLPKPIFKIFKKYVLKFYRQADYLVVVNPSFIKDLVECNLDKDKIIYIPNYVSKDKFYKYDLSKKNELRKEYKIKEDEFVVLSVGQVQTRKGVKDFIDCAKKCPHLKFIWAGGFSFGKITDGYDELKAIMDNPPSNVEFLGIIEREKMNDLYNISDVLFVPSYNELFPMTILEAINSDLPIVLRDLDLYHDILFKDYLKASNNEDFCNILIKLAQDKKYYQKASDISHNLAIFYSKEKVLKMWEDFYTKIVKND